MTDESQLSVLSSVGAARRAHRRQSPRRRREAVLGYAFLAPVTLVLLALLGYPLVKALIMSLHRQYVGFDVAPFVGLRNYVDIVHDPTYWHAFQNTIVFTVASVVLKLGLGLLTAIVLNREFRGRGLARSVVLIPWALPTVVTVLVWSWMYNDSFGLVNHLLSGLHLAKPHSWLGDPSTAMPAVVVVDVWRGFPFFALILLAGLQGIPEELYEVASIDGAGRWRQFRYVTWPGIATVALVVTLLSTIWTLNEFSLIWVLTQGGPGDATTVLSVLTFKAAFLGNKLSYGVAVSATLLPIVVLLILALVRAVNRREATT
ncbi:MAG TPA: sugar ABC transporter permease [Micromonosporaceae bacterium]